MDDLISLGELKKFFSIHLGRGMSDAARSELWAIVGPMLDAQKIISCEPCCQTVELEEERREVERLEGQFKIAFRLALQEQWDELFEFLSYESPEAIIHSRLKEVR